MTVFEMRPDPLTDFGVVVSEKHGCALDRYGIQCWGTDVSGTG